MTHLVPRGAPVQVPATTIYAYPISPPAQQSLTEAGALVMEVLAIFNEAGDKLQRALRKPYPCALCPTDMAGWPEWQMRRHFAQHPLKARAAIVGWKRALTQW